MKLLRYGAAGIESPGLIDENGELRDLRGHVHDICGEALLPSNLARLKALDSSGLPRVEGQRRLEPCVGGVGKIVCVGLNYSDHAAESGMAVPSEPVLFLKPPSAIVGPNDDVEIPPGALKTDWEVELGVIIGRPGRYLAQERALEQVAGYCIVNDLSERSYQLERGGQWIRVKVATRSPRSARGWWQLTRCLIPKRWTCGSMWTGSACRVVARGR
jgi:2-keto-4-pentenoate hydratase/2-oxohepta-3-ene-1,7-dioic acid hydratase in catechol pathway